MRVQTMSIREFMAGENKEHKEKKDIGKLVKRIGISISVPILATKPVFAAESVEAAPVGATQYIGEKTLETLAHIFDPLMEIVISISFPTACLMILFKLFMSFFKDSAEIWEGIAKISFTYLLIQLSPLFLEILKNLGSAFAV